MVNYQNAKVYKLWSDQSDCFYVGSTTVRLNKRLHQHLTRMREGKRKIADMMKQHTNIKIELIENFPCNSKEEIYVREGHYIRLYREQLLNQRIAGRPLEEYRKEYIDANREIKNRKDRERYDKNREEILKKIKKYQDKNRDERNRKERERYHRKKLNASSPAAACETL